MRDKKILRDEIIEQINYEREMENNEGRFKWGGLEGTIEARRGADN